MSTKGDKKNNHRGSRGGDAVAELRMAGLPFSKTLATGRDLAFMPII